MKPDPGPFYEYAGEIRSFADLTAQERVRMAGDPDTHPVLLVLLAADANGSVRYTLAGNPAIAEAVHAVMAQHPAPSWGVAFHPAISRTEDRAFAAAVADHPGLLEFLASDPDPTVQAALSRNPNRSRERFASTRPGVS